MSTHRHGRERGRRRVLAVRADSLGDVLVTGPAIRALSARASVTVLAGPQGADAARMLRGVDRVIVHPLPWIEAAPPPVEREAMETIVDDVRALAVDDAVVFTSFHQSALPIALLLRLAGVPRIAAISDDYPGALLDVRHRVRDDVHEVERACSLAAAAGYPLPATDDARLAIRLPASPVARRARVVVHPGASVTARAWEPDRYRALVRSLARDGLDVVVTGSRGERALTAFVAGAEPGVTDLGGATSFAELADVIRRAAVVVCGNTGPAHLAAAVGTPVVSLYAPTVPAVRWRPWCVTHRLLGVQDVACAGCRARECPVPGHPCLDVPVRDVLRAIAELAPPSIRRVPVGDRPHGSWAA
jgi:ADP-heptose:LPS heptosyltransferase